MDIYRWIAITCAAQMLAVPLLMVGIGAWLLNHPTTLCLADITNPVFCGGVGMIVLTAALTATLLRCPDSKYGKQLILVSFCGMVQIIIILVFVAILALTVGAKHGSAYAKWVNETVNETQHWRDIKHCIYETQVCSHFQLKYGGDSPLQFFSRQFSPLESGCCKPPNECNFNYSGPTIWKKPKNGTTYSNSDCYAWDNDPKKLCYNCQSCKGSLALDAKNKWLFAGIYLTIVLFIWIVGVTCMCIIGRREA